MSDRTIEYFLSTASPWAYLGHGELQRIAARHGAEIVCRPMPVRRLFDETGGLPLPKRHPVRQAYRLVELQRWREVRGLAARPEAGASARRFRAGRPGRDRSGAIRPRPAALRGRRHGGPLGRPARPVAGGHACSPGRRGRPAGPDILHAAASDAVAAAYEANLADAMAAGVFGAPSYVLDGEVFWGQDRLALLDEALASGREAYRPG